MNLYVEGQLTYLITFGTSVGEEKYITNVDPIVIMNLAEEGFWRYNWFPSVAKRIKYSAQETLLRRMEEDGVDLGYASTKHLPPFGDRMSYPLITEVVMGLVVAMGKQHGVQIWFWSAQHDTFWVC